MSGTWPRPTSEEFERDQERRKFFRQNLWQPPNLESLGNFVGGMVRIEQIGSTQFQRVSVSHSDPEFALWMLNTAFVEADNLLREKDRGQSAERRAYIERELAKQSMIQVQDALRAQLSNEVSRSELPFEFMLNALRLIDGVPLIAFSERTGMPLSAIEKSMQAARDKGLLAHDMSHIRPTEKGFDFLSDLQSLFLPASN